MKRIALLTVIIMVLSISFVFATENDATVLSTPDSATTLENAETPKAEDIATENKTDAENTATNGTTTTGDVATEDSSTAENDPTDTTTESNTATEDTHDHDHEHEEVTKTPIIGAIIAIVMIIAIVALAALIQK